MTDSIMRSLLDVHRTELNERDAALKLVTDNANTAANMAKWDLEKLQRKYDAEASRVLGLRKTEDMLRAELATTKEKLSSLGKQIKKLQEANESLNALLTSERSAHTAYRDTHGATDAEQA